MKDSIHGSTWWKCDFHNHTPKSVDYGNHISTKENMTPREWLLGYMRKEIDCVGVTDHNSGEWIDILKSELIVMEQEHPRDTEYRKLYLEAIQIGNCTRLFARKQNEAWPGSFRAFWPSG